MTAPLAGLNPWPRRWPPVTGATGGPVDNRRPGLACHHYRSIDSATAASLSRIRGLEVHRRHGAVTSGAGTSPKSPRISLLMFAMACASGT